MAATAAGKTGSLNGKQNCPLFQELAGESLPGASHLTAKGKATRAFWAMQLMGDGK